MKVEPIFAELNELRKETSSGDEDVEGIALYHAFCFVSYEVGPFTEFVEQSEEPIDGKAVPPGPRAKELLAALEGLREEAAGDEDAMEFIALDKTTAFISRKLGDFQSYLNETEKPVKGP